MKITISYALKKLLAEKKINPFSITKAFIFTKLLLMPYREVEFNRDAIDLLKLEGFSYEYYLMIRNKEKLEVTLDIFHDDESFELKLQVFSDEGQLAQINWGSKDEPTYTEFKCEKFDH